MMRRFIFALCLLMPAVSQNARADEATVKGTFIGPGIYATAEGCQKLSALAAGGDQNVGTVPETLTEDGFEGWEGSCTFTSVTEVEPGKKWKTEMQCAEGPDENEETDIFERLPDGALKVTQDNHVTMFQRCDAAKGK